MTSNSNKSTTKNTEYLEAQEQTGKAISFSPLECQVPWQMPGAHHEHCLGPLLGWDITAMEETIQCYNDSGCRCSDRYSAYPVVEK